MKQILLIFRKDCRHHLPEILVSLAVAAAFVWVYPWQWLPEDEIRTTASSMRLDVHHQQMLANLITSLLPISWFILIARVTHGENLLGNRQFWITRPYRWHLLLIEKLLFLCVFICVPFALAETALLYRGGFSIVHFIPNLLYSVFTIASLTVIPVFALATVCSTLLRMLIPILSITGIAIAVAFFTSSSPSKPSVSVPYSDNFSLPIILLICFVVLLLQYSTRRLWLSRLLLAAIPVAITIIAIFPYEIFLFSHYYPAAEPSAPSPINLTFIQKDAQYIRVTTSPGPREIQFPVHITGIPGDATLTPDNIRITLTAPDGAHSTSAWQPISYQSSQHLDKDSDYYTLVVSADRPFLDRYQSELLSLTYEIAFTQLAPEKSVATGYAKGPEWSLPGIGNCEFNSGNSLTFSKLHCRVPFHMPHLARLTFLETPSPCMPGDDPRAETQFATAWTGSLIEEPADIGFTSVWIDDIYLSHDQLRPMADPPSTFTVCPGAPVTVTQYRLVRRFVYKFTTANVDLRPQPEPPAEKPKHRRRHQPQPEPTLPATHSRLRRSA